MVEAESESTSSIISHVIKRRGSGVHLQVTILALPVRLKKKIRNCCTKTLQNKKNIKKNYLLVTVLALHVSVRHLLRVDGLKSCMMAYIYYTVFKA